MMGDLMASINVVAMGFPQAKLLIISKSDMPIATH
jgi:hypothetical protein